MVKVVKMWIVIWTGGPSAGHAALGWCSSESHQGEPKAFSLCCGSSVSHQGEPKAFPPAPGCVTDCSSRFHPVPQCWFFCS